MSCMNTGEAFYSMGDQERESGSAAKRKEWLSSIASDA